MVEFSQPTDPKNKTRLGVIAGQERRAEIVGRAGGRKAGGVITLFARIRRDVLFGVTCWSGVAP